MRRDLPKTYDPKLVESEIYDMWLENDCFKAEPERNRNVKQGGGSVFR